MGQNRHQQDMDNMHSVVRTKSKAECRWINTKAISSGLSLAASPMWESSFICSSTTCGCFCSKEFLRMRTGPSTWLTERTVRHYSSTGPCLWHSAWSQRCSSAHNYSKCSTWYTKAAFTKSTNYCDMVTKLASCPYQSLQPWATFGRLLQYLSTLSFGRATRSSKSRPKACTYTVRMNTLIRWCTSRRPS